MNPNAKHKDRFEDDAAVTSPHAKRQKPATVMAGKAEPFPKDIPMENKYIGKKYYVRECYAQYYDVVMDLLRTKDGVTLTGTPGIGTSLCMAYFFQRYSREHPNATIIMASYSASPSVLMKVVIARGQQVIHTVRYAQAAMEKALSTYALAAVQAGDRASIWLLDGIPTTIPVDDVRLVSFSTPDESWMKQLAKNPGTCAKVYMPVWTLEELREAALVLDRLELLEPADDNELLDFGVDPAYLDPTVPRPAVLDLRFAVFSGVARWCFIDRVRPSFGSLRGELYGLLRDGVQSATVVTVVRAPSVLHFVPSTRTPRLATIRVASTTVQQYFTAREQSIAESKPTAFEQSVRRGIPEMETILAFSMTVRLYRRLQFHCTAEATKLGGEGDKYLLLDSLHGSNMHWLTSSFGMTPFRDGEPQWATPFGTSLLSSNSFYWMPDPGRVVFFQVTASMQYPVNASGYTKVLKKLGLWEAAQQSPHTVAALVFVVPKWDKDTFRAQPISSHPLLDDATPVMC